MLERLTDDLVQALREANPGLYVALVQLIASGETRQRIMQAVSDGTDDPLVLLAVDMTIDTVLEEKYVRWCNPN
jgi:hypothetical protein